MSKRFVVLQGRSTSTRLTRARRAQTFRRRTSMLVVGALTSGLLAVLPSSPAAAATACDASVVTATFIGGGADRDLTTADNWNTGVVPGPTDVACVLAGQTAVLRSGDFSVAQFEIQSGASLVMASPATLTTSVAAGAEGFVNGGDLSAEGSIFGNLTNNGNFAVGGFQNAAVATLAVSGTFAQSASATLNVDWVGATTDRLTVGAGSALGGTLAVATPGATDPSSGDSVSPLSYTSLPTGTFASTTVDVPSVSLVPTYGTTSLSVAALATKANVSGIITNDINRDTSTAGEPGAAGITVYADLDSSGTLSTGDLSATTGTNGAYVIADVPNGVRAINVVPPTNGVVSVDPSDTVTVNGVAVNGINGAVTYAGSISGVVFADINANNAVNAGEGVPGAIISIDRNGDGVAETSTPNALGEYTLTSVPDGVFVVTVTAPRGAGAVAPQSISVANGAPTAGSNFKLVFGGSITGTIFNDVNNNGLANAGEPPATGVVVYVDRDASGTFNSGDIGATTAANGTYTIVGVPDGVQDVAIVPPNDGSVKVDPNDAVSIVGVQVANIDGAVRYSGSVSGTEWFDANKNKRLDPGEGVSGALVGLDRNGDRVDEAIQTASDGTFTFPSVPSGTYTLGANPPSAEFLVTGGRFTITNGQQRTGVNLQVFRLSESVSGYYLAAADGGVFGFGNAVFRGSLGATKLNAPIVDIAVLPDGSGYYLVAADGGVFGFGNAPFLGSSGAIKLNSPIVGMTLDPDGRGYWLVAADGGVFAFDAPFVGSMGGQPLNKPIVDMAADTSGSAYWLVASDGGIFAFGTEFAGSMGGQPLNQPIVGMAADPDGVGYWLVAADGGMFSFLADFHGSTGAMHLNQPIVGMASSGVGGGYHLVASDGGIFSFPTGLPFFGSAGGSRLNQPIVGMASF